MAALLHNPMSAGGRGANRAAAAQRALAANGIATELVATSGPGDAIRLARRLAQSGASRILAVGGDGTISEAAEGVLHSGRDVDVGFLPGGSGNDFLLHFDVRSLDDAARRIAEGKPRRIDAMRVRWDGGERHAIGVFGIGFAANVTKRANGVLKLFGARAYTLAVFPEVVKLRAPLTRLDLDGETINEPFSLVAVCNTRFAGGGMCMAPEAVVDDGLLDVIALRRVGRAKLLARLLPSIFSGTHVGRPEVLHRRARRVRIEPLETSPLLGDGELYGVTPVEIEARPQALNLLV